MFHLSDVRRYHAWTLLLAFGASVEARADFFLHHWESHKSAPEAFHFDVAEHYYTTTTNFDADGAQMLPAGLNQYKRWETDAQALYGLTPKLTAYGRTAWAYVSLDHTTLSGNSFGFLDQSLGLNFRVWDQPKGPLSIELQAQGDFPLYNNNSANTLAQPYLGDGSIDLTGGGFVSFTALGSDSLNHAQLNLVAGAGFTYRTANFSRAIPLSLEARYSRTDKGLFGSAGLFGMQSLKSDPNATRVQGTSASAGAGGSFLVNAVNPSLLGFRGELGYQFKPDWAAVARFSRPIMGQAAPLGMDLAFGFEASWGGNAQSRTRPLEQVPVEFGRANQGFVDYTLEARVLRTNDRLNLVKIDKGSQDGVEEGQIFDIFRVKQDGTAVETIARAKVTSVSVNEAALTVTEYYKEVWIDQGFVAKRPLQ